VPWLDDGVQIATNFVLAVADAAHAHVTSVSPVFNG
jgi:hypothetical protein